MSLSVDHLMVVMLSVTDITTFKSLVKTCRKALQASQMLRTNPLFTRHQLKQLHFVKRWPDIFPSLETVQITSDSIGLFPRGFPLVFNVVDWKTTPPRSHKHATLQTATRPFLDHTSGLVVSMRTLRGLLPSSIPSSVTTVCLRESQLRNQTSVEAVVALSNTVKSVWIVVSEETVLNLIRGTLSPLLAASPTPTSPTSDSEPQQLLPSPSPRRPSPSSRTPSPSPRRFNRNSSRLSFTCRWAKTPT